MRGLTTERFCFSDRTSPSRTSRVRAPTYTAASRDYREGPSGSRLLPQLEGLDHVAHMDVVVADPDTALEAFPDLGRVLLEPAQRLDGEVLGNHHTIPDQPGLAVPRDRAGPDDGAGHVADPRHPEDFADLCSA